MELKATTYEVVNRTAVITLNRPHRGNAWTGRMHAEYRQCLQEAERNSGVRTVIVTGAGDKFCVGGDADALSGHAARGSYDDGLVSATIDRPVGAHDKLGNDPDERSETQSNLRSFASEIHPEFEPEFAYHFALSKPVIAAMNGAAAGIGLALACFADLRFAVSNAKLTTAHGKLALPPEYGLSWLLPRQVGLPRALDVLMTSRVFTTDEAHSWGLVTDLVDKDDLLDHCLAYTEELARTVAADSLRASRQMVYLDLHRGVGQSVTESLERLDKMMGTSDYRKGVEALNTRRSPDF